MGLVPFQFLIGHNADSYEINKKKSQEQGIWVENSSLRSGLCEL